MERFLDHDRFKTYPREFYHPDQVELIKVEKDGNICKYLLTYIAFLFYKEFIMQNFVYRFPVVKGIQAGRSYYIAMIPLKMLSRLFPDDTEFVPPEFRAQRRLNETRIPVISRYITDNPNSYVFSALAASIDGEFQFLPNEKMSNTGILEVSMDARFQINDGQHRKAAILSALNENPDLGDETISIVFYQDKGLERSQQIFADLNKHAVKTSNSIAELYDSRDSLALLTKDVVEHVAFFNKFTDKEKDSLGKYSSKLFTFNTIYEANKRLVRSRHMDEELTDSVIQYWKTVVSFMRPWNDLESRQLSKIDLRENYVAIQGVVIKALGMVGYWILNHPEADCKSIISRLEDVDWSRSAKDWHGRIINQNGKIITSSRAIDLACNVIKQKLKIPLTSEEKTKEANFAGWKNSRVEEIEGGKNGNRNCTD